MSFRPRWMIVSRPQVNSSTDATRYEIKSMTVNFVPTTQTLSIIISLQSESECRSWLTLSEGSAPTAHFWVSSTKPIIPSDTIKSKIIFTIGIYTFDLLHQCSCNFVAPHNGYIVREMGKAERGNYSNAATTVAYAWGRLITNSGECVNTTASFPFSPQNNKSMGSPPALHLAEKWTTEGVCKETKTSLGV